LRCRRDLSDFKQFEAERFDLGKDAEQCGPVFKASGEHGFAALQLRRHGGKGGKGGGSETTLDPERVQARRHAIILPPNLVSRRRRNLVIVETLALHAVSATL
jgi:hypothetical protein